MKNDYPKQDTVAKLGYVIRDAVAMVASQEELPKQHNQDELAITYIHDHQFCRLKTEPFLSITEKFTERERESHLISNHTSNNKCHGECTVVLTIDRQ